MNKEIRIKKLKEFESKPPCMQGLPLRYKGGVKRFNAYQIPLEFLIYNKYNGRILSWSKTFEKQNYVLNEEESKDIRIIEKFLWDSKPDRNDTTKKSLIEYGQQKYGIVTANGIIIDGNRRAMLLNKIYKERESLRGRNVDHAQYFIAIILPEDATPKEIKQLETTYQMGEDEKLDYNPIEKYLKCKDLQDEGFEVVDIANMMAEKQTRIKEWLEIMKLMKEYLAHFDYSGLYTMLEGREGQFVDLNSYLKSYTSRNGKGKAKAQWGYDDTIDVAELKAICFDYIRAQYEGKEFRYIAKPSAKDSVFCNEKLWPQFKENHYERVNDIKEKNPAEWIQAGSAESTKQLELRDNEWTEKVMPILKGNLKKSMSRLEDIKEADKPKELLQKAKDTLQEIDIDLLVELYEPSVLTIVKEINRMTYEMKKSIEKLS